MATDHNPEHGPIEDESSLIEQSVGVAIGMLDSVIAEIKDPTSTFTYDITCDPSTHLKDLKEIMTHLEDAYEAMTPAHLKAEADAEHQADAQAELEADVRCYDDLEGGWY